MPLIIKKAARYKTRRVIDPTYTEMRKTKLEPNMSEKKKWAYRGKGIHMGEQAGAIGGVALGSTASAVLGHMLKSPKLIRSKRVSNALGSWVLPPMLTYLGYTLGARTGKVKGERYARKKLRESGNPIKYENPLSRTERSPFDPLLLGGALLPRAAVAGIGEKGNKKIVNVLDKGFRGAKRIITKR